MQIHDLRCNLIPDNEKNFIGNVFPLRMGEFDIEISKSYNLNSKEIKF